jgi:DNA-binding transcriptional MerR regulator
MAPFKSPGTTPEKFYWSVRPTVKSMRIGRLAERSGVSVPTIKFYLRAGLLPRGEPTSHNQAEYGERHLRRLRLIDALTGVGGMTVHGARDVLAAVDDANVPAADLLRTVDEALPSRHTRVLDARSVAAALRAMPAGLPADRLAEVYAVAGLFDLGELFTALPAYAAAASNSSACDVEVLRAYAARRRLKLDPTDPAVREALVLITLLGGAVQSSMTGCHRPPGRW